MDQVRIETRAKINRGLKILGQRPDGYHLIQSIMVPIDLKDQLTLTKRDKGIIFETNALELDWDKTNFCRRCLELLEEKLGRSFPVMVQLEKRIPIGAGLAGGTVNGAGILKGLNQLYDLNLDLETLQEWALNLGADFPFCLYDQPAIVGGIGEKVQAYQGKEEPILLVNPGYELSTKDVYTWFDQDRSQGLQDDKINDLEGPVLRRKKDLLEIRQALEESGAYEVSMSGSGPTFYGVYKTLDNRNRIKEKLGGQFAKVIACQTEI